MATTKAMKIIRQLAGPNVTVFNDKLSNGKRSFKVLGWSQNDYSIAKFVLWSAGFNVNMLTFKKHDDRDGREYVQTRLHVTE